MQVSKEDQTGLYMAYEILRADRDADMPTKALEQRLQVFEAIEILLGKKDMGTAGKSPYEVLKKVFWLQSNLDQANDVVCWLKQTNAKKKFFFPDSYYNTASATLKTLEHKIIAHETTRRAIELALESKDELTEDDRLNFELMHKQWLFKCGLPTELVEAIASAKTECETKLAEARAANNGKGDYTIFQPALERMCQLMRKKGEIIGKILGCDPYEALVQEEQVGLSLQTIKTVFSQLQQELPPLIKQIMEKQTKAQRKPVPLSPIPLPVQERIMQRLITLISPGGVSYPLADGLGGAASYNGWADARISAKYDEKDILRAVFATMHETGHAMYYAYQPQEWQHQPLGRYQSMWVHETQSLFWERTIGYSREFIQHLNIMIIEELQNAGLPAPESVWNTENLRLNITQVQPSLRRLKADEATYPLHVVLRFNIEQALIADPSNTHILPALWQEQMQELLGIDVPNDAEGCLQDVHWGLGLFGSFPGYTFGAIGNSQLVQAMGTEAVKEFTSHQQFAPMHEYMNYHIWQHGSKHSGEELFQMATGKGPSASSLVQHIKTRYLGNAQEIAAPGHR